MNRHIKVTIVVPIYNVEKYLERCIKSLVNQTYSNIEIVLVNDGSPDKSPEICESWSKADSRIRVINKQNAGLGMARNSGIDFATGDYITFVDGDDYLLPFAIEKAVEPLTEKQVDSVVFGFNDIGSGGVIRSTYIPEPVKVEYYGDEVQEYFLPDLIAPDIGNGFDAGLWMSASGCLLSCDTIRRTGFRFASERKIISEDVYSLIQFYSHARSVIIIREALYCYCLNESSLTHTYREDRFERVTDCYVKMVELVKELKLSDKLLPRIAYKYISNTISAFKMIVVSTMNQSDKIKLIAKALETPVFHEMLLSLNYKHEAIARKILIICMKHKWKYLVYCLALLKSK